LDGNQRLECLGSEQATGLISRQLVASAVDSGYPVRARVLGWINILQTGLSVTGIDVLDAAKLCRVGVVIGLCCRARGKYRSKFIGSMDT
jgi:hypothetical protein